MAELAAGILGAAATAGAAAFTSTSGFTGRHESSHREEIIDTRRNMADFMENRETGDVTPDEETEFLNTRDEKLNLWYQRAIRRQNEYYKRIESYKEASWLNPLTKLKKRDNVRKAKRLTSQSNHSLRSLNEPSTISNIGEIMSTGPVPVVPISRPWLRTRGILRTAWMKRRWLQTRLGIVQTARMKKRTGGSIKPEDIIPVSIGDPFSDSRYFVVRKLTWDKISTVWRAYDVKSDKPVALHVFKSAPRYTRTVVDEIKLLQCLITSSDPNTPNSHPGKSHLLCFLDHFRQQGPNGAHLVMTFEYLGSNLRNLMELHHKHENLGVPLWLGKQIAKQVLLGLDYMHCCCDVIHTAIKPENLLVDDILHPETMTVKIAGLRNATWTNSPVRDNNGSRQYCCPEIICETSWGTSADIWSVACVLFELLTGNVLFASRGFLAGYMQVQEHLAQMIALLGELPEHVRKSAPGKFFDSKGELLHMVPLLPFPLPSVLRDEYHFPESEASAIVNFLLLMLELDASARATAEELLRHPWLYDVPAVERKFDDGHEAGAMKPVDDVLLQECGGLPPSHSESDQKTMDGELDSKESSFA
ncbi:kinase-like domain-containing protein [Mycena epipterygia]|nr:kinase-like domain-containing protein [Mycena epipterygia]